jgi:hypothetical protein
MLKEKDVAVLMSSAMSMCRISTPTRGYVVDKSLFYAIVCAHALLILNLELPLCPAVESRCGWRPRNSNTSQPKKLAIYVSFQCSRVHGTH